LKSLTELRGRFGGFTLPSQQEAKFPMQIGSIRLGGEGALNDEDLRGQFHRV
jgi:hypothetical protein